MMLIFGWVMLSVGAVLAGEARVQLFGQPCLMVGPSKYSSTILVKIHQISPEVFSPPAQLDDAKKKLQQLEKTEGLPPEFKVYKAKLLRRFQAFVKVHELLALAKPKLTETVWTEVLAYFNSGSRNLVRSKLTNYLATVEKNRGRSSDEAKLDVILEITEFFDSNAEVEFHKIIEAVQIRYQCDFDANVEN